MSNYRPLDEFEEEERQNAFFDWMDKNATWLGLGRIPRQHRRDVIHMVKRAYNAGSNFERAKLEPVRVGGD